MQNNFLKNSVKDLEKAVGNYYSIHADNIIFIQNKIANIKQFTNKKRNYLNEIYVKNNSLGSKNDVKDIGDKINSLTNTNNLPNDNINHNNHNNCNDKGPNKVCFIKFVSFFIEKTKKIFEEIDNLKTQNEQIYDKRYESIDIHRTNTMFKEIVEVDVKTRISLCQYQLLYFSLYKEILNLLIKEGGCLIDDLTQIQSKINTDCNPKELEHYKRKLRDLLYDCFFKKADIVDINSNTNSYCAKLCDKIKDIVLFKTKSD